MAIKVVPKVQSLVEVQSNSSSGANTLRVSCASFSAPFPLILQGLCRFNGP